jgi:hypothetical protein
MTDHIDGIQASELKDTISLSQRFIAATARKTSAQNPLLASRRTSKQRSNRAVTWRLTGQMALVLFAILIKLVTRRNGDMLF